MAANPVLIFTQPALFRGLLLVLTMTASAVGFGGVCFDFGNEGAQKVSTGYSYISDWHLCFWKSKAIPAADTKVFGIWISFTCFNPWAEESIGNDSLIILQIFGKQISLHWRLISWFGAHVEKSMAP